MRDAVGDGEDVQLALDKKITADARTEDECLKSVEQHSNVDDMPETNGMELFLFALPVTLCLAALAFKVGKGFGEGVLI